jgi:hypothetical protein
MPREFVAVDPRMLHLLPAASGGDPAKLQRQISRFGSSMTGMPPLRVYRGNDGGLVIFDGITRATRAAKLMPGVPVQVEVIGELKAAVRSLHTIGDQLQ